MTASPILIAAFYHFVALPDYQAMQAPLKQRCVDAQLKGSILLAHEGINGTLAGEPSALRGFLQHLRQDTRFATMTWKESHYDRPPFQRLKVRLKKEIVTLGVPDLPLEQRGEYVSPHDWDALIQQPDVLVIDTRNDYEVALGTFQGAVNPHTADFRALPAWVKANLDPAQHTKIAMFCTGGIRCEKSTAYLKQQGFEQVYHLDGGILNYFAATRNASGAWQGHCFVFDERVAVTPTLDAVDSVPCATCGVAVTTDDLKALQGDRVVCLLCNES